MVVEASLELDFVLEVVQDSFCIMYNCSIHGFFLLLLNPDYALL